MKTPVNLTMTLILGLALLCACGKEKDTKDSTPDLTQRQHNPPSGPQELEGRYEAILRPLNTPVSGFIPSGKAQIMVEGDSFSASTYLEDDTKVQHIQSIHEGTRCPTEEDDTNKDGFIDIVEMKQATGNVLIPLDGDLNSQIRGQDFYPKGKSFTYEKTGNVTEMLEDLYAPASLADSFSKLPSGSPINLEGRVIIIHGTSDISRVPETVQTMEDRPRNITVPITCGVIKRMRP